MTETLLIILVITIALGVLLNDRNFMAWAIAIQILRNNDQRLVHQLAPSLAEPEGEASVADKVMKLLPKGKSDE